MTKPILNFLCVLILFVAATARSQFQTNAFTPVLNDPNFGMVEWFDGTNGTLHIKQLAVDNGLSAMVQTVTTNSVITTNATTTTTIFVYTNLFCTNDTPGPWLGFYYLSGMGNRPGWPANSLLSYTNSKNYTMLLAAKNTSGANAAYLKTNALDVLYSSANSSFTNLSQLHWVTFGNSFPNLEFYGTNGGTTNIAIGSYQYLASFPVNSTNYSYTTNSTLQTNSAQTQITGNSSTSAGAVTNNGTGANVSFVGADATVSNFTSIAGLRVTENILQDNVNFKPYIAFASCINRMSTGQCSCIVIGDSMSGVNYYNSITKNMIWMLQNNYGWVGDYCFISDQLGVSMNVNNWVTNYWFGVGGVGVQTNDTGSGSWTQGVQNGGSLHFTTRVWPANQASLIYIKQPLGGATPWQAITYGDGRSADYRPNNNPYPGFVLNTFSASTNVARTDWAVPLNYFPGSYQSIRQNFNGVSGATGTNVFIGAGFENTNATGLRTYWLGDNGPIGGGGSTTLTEYLSPGTNVLHQFATLVKPDFIIYHAKDMGEGGNTNISQMQANISLLLGTNGLSITNTKVFVIATPGQAYPVNSTTSNNAAIRLACEANGWSYIDLCDDWSAQLYGSWPGNAGVDPLTAPTGIIADSVHPSDWGAWLMAWSILTRELRVPIRYEPQSKYNGVLQSYQQFPFVNSVDNNWGVPTPALAFQSQCSPDVRPFVMAGGTTNMVEINALNALCARLRANGLWPNGTNKTLCLWPMIGGTERTVRFNLIDPAANYLGITTANDSVPTNGFAISSLGLQPTNIWRESYRNTGINTGIREENVTTTSPFANGPNGTSDLVSNNIVFSFTNTCLFLGLKRTSTNNPTQEGLWITGNTIGASVIQNGEWDNWYGSGFANIGYPSAPLAGVVGWVVTNGYCGIYTNSVLVGSVINGNTVSQAAYETRFANGPSGYGAPWSLWTNAVIYCAGYGCGYSAAEFTNLQAIINQFGLDKTNGVINRNLLPK